MLFITKVHFPGSDRGNRDITWVQLTTVPKITALIHAHADAARIGRLLDSLRPCDEVLLISHGGDDTQKVARKHGATVKEGVAGVSAGVYLADAANDWIFCVRPDEAFSEALEATLFDWKQKDPGDALAFSVGIREETPAGWKSCPPETRLVNRNRINWTTELPPYVPSATLLAGDLLRFCNP